MAQKPEVRNQKPEFGIEAMLKSLLIPSCFAALLLQAAAAEERFELFGRSQKLQACEEIQGGAIKAIPESASPYLRIICARDSQFVVANPPWIMVGAASKPAIFAAYRGAALEKGRVFDAASVREIPAEDAKAEFLSHYDTKRMVIPIGETEPRPDPFVALAKANAEKQLEARPFGETAMIVELASGDVHHSIYLFVNGGDEFTGAAVSKLGAAKQLEPFVVTRRQVSQ